MGSSTILSSPATTAQIGKCGEILVQYRLLRCGIESAPMATDTGIDLVAYSPASRRAITIQVKANLRAKPSGGKGALALDWWIPVESPAELFALVDLASDSVWLFTHAEIEQVAQQRAHDRLHFYLYIESGVRPRGTGKSLSEFESYRIDKRISEIFGSVGHQVSSIAPRSASRISARNPN